jgi:hypothetical protein
MSTFDIHVFYLIMKTDFGKLLYSGLGLLLLIAPLHAQPIITSQPVSQAVILGGNATFSVMVTGVGPLNFQWQFNGTNLPNIISTVAGNGTQGFSGDGGPATNAELNNPRDMVIDANGNLFIADNAASRIRKVDTNGIITTVAGNGNQNYLGDGGAATNACLAPNDLTVDSTGNLIIADIDFSRIRKIDTNGIITTVAGNGTANSFGNYSGDGSAATNASLNGPTGVVLDSSGNLYIADSNNHRVRKVNTNGIITTVAGNGSFSYSGDGGAATNASFGIPSGVAMDTYGNLFIADVAYNIIRKVGTNGVVTTVAGNGSGAYSGDGGPATNASLSGIYSVAVDGYGNIFIPDYGNNRIRKVDKLGIITTLAGDGEQGPFGDGGIATLAQFNQPVSVRLDSYGNLLIADRFNHRIRKVLNNQGPTLPLFQPTMVNAGNYQVVITNASGSVTSSVVTLNLQLPPLTPSFTASNGVVSFNWSAVSNQIYQLQYAPTLMAPVWTDLGSPVTATSNTATTADVVGADSQRFYRVRLWP